MKSGWWGFLFGLHVGGLIFIWAMEYGYQHHVGTLGNRCLPGDMCRDGLTCIKVKRSLATLLEDSRCVSRSKMTVR